MTSITVRVHGRLEQMRPVARQLLLNRGGEHNQQVVSETRRIIARVREDGDRALRELAQQFDRVALDELEVQPSEWVRALDALDPTLRTSLERAARNITTVHRAFMPAAIEVSPEPGIIVGRRPDALQRVGVYAPGGRAAYPSSLLMGALPARVAGVREVIVCTPPSSDGKPSTIVLAAAALAKVDRVFSVGGAGAIAALALGTESIPRVDRIVGPGNAYVAEAKAQLASTVAIDSPAGPSELLVLADDTADVDVIAREMTAQAEHDPQAAVLAILVGAGADAMGARLLEALQRTADSTPRQEIVQAALATRGAILTTSSLHLAIEFANEWAAEHLFLAVAPRTQSETLAQLRAAGTIFLGESSSVAFGDYMTGANHVLPTAGMARCYSGLSTLDFIRWTSWQRVSESAATSLAPDVAMFAEAEGLPAHAAAARAWQTQLNSPSS